MASFGAEIEVTTTLVCGWTGGMIAWAPRRSGHHLPNARDFQ
jgi:hypothetical protein